MDKQGIISHITNWIQKYAEKSKMKGFVVGVSGGIDSAVTSILASKANLPVLCVEMPIHQSKNEMSRSEEHIDWLKKNYSNVDSINTDLTKLFNTFSDTVHLNSDINSKLAFSNTRARLRMTTLYYYAQLHNYLVLGTGNKVEDFGIGFYTKYGDGGVDISPIADLLKTEVFSLAQELGVCKNILEAAPTDGLWEDNRTDEEQIGATYIELEWAMNYVGDLTALTEREKQILNIYKTLNTNNQHKMRPIPICKIPNKFK